MKLLVIDLYNYKRDLAQTDMYKALKDEYDLIFANKKKFYNLVKEGDYDFLYLGIYHPWCGVNNLEEILKINKKPVIIDQADNEGFMFRISSKNIYPENSVLLSRYLPHVGLSRMWKGKMCLLPWYIDSNRFEPKEKTTDVSFVCTIDINNRIGADRKKMRTDIKNYCVENNLSHVVGQYYDNYSDIIGKSKVMIIDGSRYCLTQKYIEAALSNCIIVGEKPTSPPNDFIVNNIEDINFEFINNVELLLNREYALREFANKDKFLSNFKEIIDILINI